MKAKELKDMMVTISQKNAKMGPIPSVSLPPIVTCKHCETCKKDCYARKFWKSTLESYAKNLQILKADRNAYFFQVKAAAMVSQYFRWHVAGDIVDIDYLHRMCKLARECKNTTFLAFTKNYEDVNDYLNNHRKPANLKLIFSLPFDGTNIDNPHNLPTAAVVFKGQEPDENWKICGGNCTECACRGVGCWELKKGETIAFYKH